MRKEDFKKETEILTDLVLRYPQLRGCGDEIWKCFLALYETFKSGGKLLLCGNGGSAADALHIVGELMKSFAQKRQLESGFAENLRQQPNPASKFLLENLEGALPAIALVESTSLNTALQNDVAAEICFAQQVYGLGRTGDALLCLTTSGNSENTYLAALAARARAMRVLSFTGNGGGKIFAVSDVCVRVPQSETYLVQELHLPVYHALCRMLEQRFFIDSEEQP